MKMSGFLEIDLPEFKNTAQDTSRDTSGICLCCFSQNVSFVNISSCKHVNTYLNDFFKGNTSLRVLCRNCHGILQKISQFMNQVVENAKLLEDLPLNTANKKLMDLKTSPMETTSIFNYKMTGSTKITENEDLTNIFITNNMLDDDDAAQSDNYEAVGNDNDVTVKVENLEEGPEIAALTSAVDENELNNTDDEEITLSKLSKLNKAKPGSKKNKVVPLGDGKIRVVTLELKEFYEEKELERMTKATYLELPFKCEDCVLGFEYEQTLRDHNMKHVKREHGYHCKLCNSYLGSENSFKEHCKRHLRRYECSVCQKRYGAFNPAIEHYKKCHGAIDTFYECPDCDFTTDLHRRFRYHRATHKNKLKCQQCDKTFVNNSARKHHIYTQHSSHKFSCKLCDKTYTSKSGLVNHHTSVHKQDGEYCVDCQTYYKTKLIYQNHLKSHRKHITDSDLKFPCEQCEGKFLTRAALKHHVNRAHLGLGKYPCGRCDKVFTTSRYIRAHIRNVHEKQPKPRNKICDHCGKGFSSNAILRNHVRTHTGERPLRCPHASCAATFAHPSALYNHRKLHKTSPRVTV